MLNVSSYKVQNRFVISAQVYLLFAPTSVFAVAVIEASREGTPTLIQLFLVSAVSYLLFLATLGMFYLIALRHKLQQSTSLISVFAIGLLLGALKGRFLALMINQIAEPEFATLSPMPRVISGAVVGAVTMPALAYLASEIARLKTTRITKLDALVAAQITQLENSGVRQFLTDQIKSRYDLKFSNKLVAVLEPIVGAPLSQSSATSILKELAVAMRLQLIEISKDVESRTSKNYPQLNLRNLVDTAFNYRPFPNVIIVPVLALNSISYLLASSPTNQFLTRLLVITTVPIIVLHLGNLVIPKMKQQRWAAWLVFVTTCVLGTFAINAFIYQDAVGDLIGSIIIYQIWSIVVCLSASLLTSFNRKRNEIDVMLTSELDESLIKSQALDQVNTKLLNELSDFIHGTMQSRLMASTVNVTAAQNTLDDAVVKLELENLRELADSPLKTFDISGEREIEEAIADLSATWQGLITIEISPETIADLQRIARAGIANVIEEALLNAFRHGQATQVSVRATVTHQELFLRITDDGIGPRNGGAGIGSSLFDALSDSWVLQNGPNGIGSLLELNFSSPAR